jgi:sugar phosphate isomerase/epimerase
MRLSTSSVHFGSLPVEEACRHISALGFAGIDFWPSPFGCRHLDEIENRLGPEGLKDVLSKHNLTLYAFSCYSVGYPKYAEILGKAGGGVAVRGSRGGKVQQDLAKEMKEFMEQLKPEIQLAERFDSTLAIENHGDALLDSLDSFKAFVEMNPNPKRLGIALAPYHLQAAKISVPEAIAIAGSQLFFFYAWQHAEGLKQLPGIGPTDCTPWIAALAKVGYRGYVNPFMHGDLETDVMVKSLSTSRDYLKECYGKAVPA